MVDTWIVIPCFNEADRLRKEEFSGFVAKDREIGLIFVNDGSTDKTASMLTELCAQEPAQMECLNLDRNRGKGEAVRAGVLHALTKDPKFVGFWDADLATPLCDIRRFRRLFDEHSALLLVTGARIRALGKRIERSVFRHYAGRFIATIISCILGVPVYDTQCGAKLFRVEGDTKNFFIEPFLSRWLFDVEILIRIQRFYPLGDVVRELSLDEWIDVGDSKVKLSHAPRILLNLFELWLVKRKNR